MGEGMSVWLYSFIYNGSYMLPELLITTVCAVICAKPRRNSFCPRTRTPRQNMVYLP